MVKFIHARTGNEMWVADDRVEEYKAAGHIPAADIPVKPANKPKRTTKKQR